MSLDTYVDYGLLPESAREETMTLTSAEQVDEFILRCARYTLLDSRRQALQAFREGFQLAFNTNGVADSDANTLDVSPVLALFTPSEAAVLVGGRSSITAAELIKLIAWPSESEAANIWHKGKQQQNASPSPPELFRQWLESQAALGEEKEKERCKTLLRCITARVAIPDPRRETVKIQLAAVETDNGGVGGPDYWPKAATCFDTLFLPRWDALEQVEKGMMDPHYGLYYQKGFSDV